MHPMKRIVSLVLLGWLSATAAMGQNTEEEVVSDKGVGFGSERKTTWRVGVVVRAKNGPMANVLATVPIPTVWPEQKVKVVKKEVSPRVKISNKDLGGVRQMMVSIRGMQRGQESKAVFTLEITRKEITEPEDTGLFVIPKRPPRDVQRWLNPSPYINSRDSKIKSLAREAVSEKESAWEKVEAIYDTVREKVEYKEGKIKSASEALRDGYGDCEELTSLFIAMCRTIKVPARMVWIPDHCYPEFYLQDDEGDGHWIPCQAAGTRAFGSMPETKPILQKGDNFKVTGKKKNQRYVAEYLSAKPVRGSGAPSVMFVREFVQPGG